MSRPGYERIWSATQTRSAAGAFESCQRIVFSEPVVEHSAAGAKRLGELYWREVERSTFGVVRARISAGGLQVRLLGARPALLRFGPPEHEVSPRTVSCRYPIRGGLLVQAPGGSITFSQDGLAIVVVCSAITGFFPRLAACRRRRRWDAMLYLHVQARLHMALGRRYFARLSHEAGR
jgi:hypothetical protein